MFTSKLILKSDFVDILDCLNQGYALFYAQKSGQDYNISKAGDLSNIELPQFRASEPIKSFLLPAKEDFDLVEERPIAVFGLKGCDLSSLAVLDYVYLEGDYKDSYYAKRRESMFIFSSDCTDFKESCFCTSLGYKPYPKEGFDLNLIKLSEDEYVLEIGTDKGNMFLKNNNLSFKNINSEKQKKIQDIRDAIAAKVQENADKYLPASLKDKLSQAVRENYDSQIWQDEASRCVECGACTVVCGSCHCFFLITKENSFDKLRSWDSCLLRSYALVAGGANPRSHLYERLRNRFIKKFDFFPKVLNTFGCTGCGRCVNACIGNIDIREILSNLIKEKVKS
ncbi:MAG: 4Fe-4S dicluster domain-containing protein [Candidatus Saelkia tenebricola]|nr:4Fe-4S dicluster domain-containing protein [Candidatus Saelkia tenebricola]